MKMIYRDVIQGDEYRVYELTPEEVQWQNDKDRGMFRRAILRNTMNRPVTGMTCTRSRKTSRLWWSAV